MPVQRLRLSSGWMWLQVALATAACAQGSSGAGTPSASQGPELRAGSGGNGDNGGACPAGAGGGLQLGTTTESCEAGKYIFLTTLDNSLMRFEPKSLALEMITQLNCKVSNAVPAAFAVDKQSVAWIIYTDGTIHKMDMNKLDCKKTDYEPNQHGWKKFSMTFNNDPTDPTGESLAVADLTIASVEEDTPVNGLGKISTSDLKLNVIGDFDGPFAKKRPLITGRSDGRLFAIFINMDRQRVTEIDPKTAKILSATPIPSPSTVFGSFAHWGGSYYHFTSADRYTNSSITRYTPGKGSKIIIKDAGHILYGSSVSTCAPTSSPDIK